MIKKIIPYSSISIKDAIRSVLLAQQEDEEQDEEEEQEIVKPKVPINREQNPRDALMSDIQNVVKVSKLYISK